MCTVEGTEAPSQHWSIEVLGLQRNDSAQPNHGLDVELGETYGPLEDGPVGDTIVDDVVVDALRLMHLPALDVLLAEPNEIPGGGGSTS